MADRSLEGMALPLEVRARLAELELELSEGNRAPAPGRAALSPGRAARGGLGARGLQRGGGRARRGRCDPSPERARPPDPQTPRPGEVCGAAILRALGVSVGPGIPRALGVSVAAIPGALGCLWGRDPTADVCRAAIPPRPEGVCGAWAPRGDAGCSRPGGIGLPVRSALEPRRPWCSRAVRATSSLAGLAWNARPDFNAKLVVGPRVGSLARPGGSHPHCSRALRGEGWAESSTSSRAGLRPRRPGPVVGGAEKGVSRGRSMQPNAFPDF
ncbi:hypothetical protein H8959_020010 [Pygathrix nigripes]